MPRHARRIALAVGLLLLLAACAAPTGGLQVTITGLPAGQNALVNVAGPGNYGTTLTTTTTLAGLTPGTYTVTASTITTTVVTTEYDATITPGTFSVVAGETADVAVVYNPTGGTLAVSTSGLPPGIDADVNVTGPDAFDQDLTTSTVLTDLTPGEYSASANPVTDGSNDYSATVNGSPAEVSSATGAGIEVAYALDPGSLDLSISGLPGGVDGNVLVEGANGFSQLISASTTLTDLTPGIYTLTARPVRSSDPIVSEVYDATTPPIEVTSNETANAETVYEVRSGAGALWVPSEFGNVLAGFEASQLLTSNADPETVTIAGLTNPVALAFDAQGNAWMGGQGQNIIYMFSPDQLAASGSPTPAVTITSDGDSVLDVRSLAFDASGNLWLPNSTNSRLEMFTPDQLDIDGSPTPTIILEDDGVGSLVTPMGMAFDADGNLWIGNQGNNTVVGFTPGQLAASGTPTPFATLSNNGSSLSAVRFLAFDSSGTLWVSNSTTDTLSGFSPAQRVTGAPVPAVALTGDGTNLDGPEGMAFDNSGNMWVANFESDTIERFSPAQLATSGSPIPEVILTGGPIIEFSQIAFSPPPSDLPINTP